MTNKSSLMTASIGTILLVIITTAMGAFDYSVQRWVALACLVGSFALIITPVGKRIFTRYTTPLFVAVASYVLWNGISMLYADVPKAALFEFTKLIGAIFVFLAVLAFTKPNKQGFNLISRCISLTTAIFGVISIDAASNGSIAAAFKDFMANFTPSMQAFGIFEDGIRITGIFGNANTFSGFVVLGVFLSLALVLNSENNKQRIFALSLLSINALTYILLFSMGSLGIFIIAAIAMLVLSSNTLRLPTFLLMLETAVITIIFTVISLTTIGESATLPLACVVLNSVCLCVTDTVVNNNIVNKISAHAKASVVAGIVLVFLVVGYIIVALNMTGPLTLSTQETVMRAIYPTAGEYKLISEVAEGSQINVSITSQNEDNLKVHDASTLYKGALENAQFTVPEDSKIVKIYMTGMSDINTLNSLSYAVVGTSSNTKDIKLNYTLLPSIAANRIQDLRANQNTIQRMVFFEDGLKLFKQSPIIGNGLSGFETNVNSVQEFYYVTRYVHNHYIQALCDLGIIGFGLFLGVLVLCVGTVMNIFKQAKASQYNSPTAFALPVMSSCVIMMFGQAITDLTWSAGPFLAIAFAILALLIVLSHKDFGNEVLEAGTIKKISDSEDSSTTKKVVTGGMVTKGVLIVSIMAMVILLGINLYATNRASSGKCTLEDMAQLAKMDKFGADDYKVSFIVTANSYGLTDYYAQADEYASELSHNPDAVLNYLLPYYFNTNQEDKVFETAKIAMKNGRSSTEKWNTLFEIIRTATNPDRNDPVPLIIHLLATDNLITENMLDCYRDLQSRNTEYLDEAMLDDANIAFVGKLLGVESLTKEQLPEAIEVFSKTIFDSTFAVDANVDGTPDNITVTAGNAVFTDGALEVSENTTIVINSYCVNGDEYTLRLSDITSTDNNSLLKNIKVALNGNLVTVQYEGNDAVINVNLKGAVVGDESSGIEAIPASIDKITITFPSALKVEQITLKR